MQGSIKAAVLAGAALAAAAVPALAGPTADAARTRTIFVGDNYFYDSPNSSPTGGKRATVARVGDTAKFRWAGEQAHNVKFKIVPKGAKKSRSPLKSSGSWSYKIKKKGIYKLVCTVHEESDSMIWRLSVK